MRSFFSACLLLTVLRLFLTRLSFLFGASDFDLVAFVAVKPADINSLPNMSGKIGFVVVRAEIRANAETNCCCRGL